MIVLDASFAVKLFIRENDTDAARAYFVAATDEIAAPDLVDVEVAQAVVRRVNAKDLSQSDGRAALALWRAMLEAGGIALSRASPGHVDTAADLAITIGHPVKDCLYLALAIERGATLVTADAKFHAKAVAIYPKVDLFRS